MTTEFVKISEAMTAEDLVNIEKAAAIIRGGGLVVFPTETVYGLGADATRQEAAEKIYSAKDRPADNPLIIHIASAGEAEAYAVTSPLYYRLAEAFMPGPLTVVLPVRDTIPRTVTAGLPTVALRCPRHPIASALIRASGVPIAAPSANLSGSPSPTNAAHVRDDMDERVDMILDGGASVIGLESTIVKIEEDDTLTLLRPGAITPEDFEAMGIRVRLAGAVLRALAPGERVLSPGMKYKHYAPRIPFYLLDGDAPRAMSYLADREGPIAVLCYEEDMPIFDKNPALSLFSVGSRKDLSGFANRLFTLLRNCDKGNFSAIYAPLPPPRGLGLALYNRMIRAAAHQIITL